MINKENIARFNNYFKAHTASDFWIRHTEDDYLKLKNSEYFYDDEEDEEEIANSFANYFANYEENNQNKNIDENFINVLKQIADGAMYDKITSKIRDFISQDYKPNQIANIKTIDSLENRIFNTKKALDNPDVKLIFRPVFLYKDLLCTPSIYNKETKTLYLELAVTSIKIKYALRAFWDTEITKKNNIEVKDYIFLHLDNSKNIKDNILIKPERKILIAASKNSDDIYIDVNDLLVNKFLNIKKPRGLVSLNPMNIEKFNDLWNSELIKSNQCDIWSEKDIDSTWGKNKTSSLIFETENNEFKNINASKYKSCKTNFFKNEPIIIKNKILTYIKEKINLINEPRVKSIISKIQTDNAIILWYDFEGFSLPFPPLNHVKPYNQIVNQVSIMKTITTLNNGVYEVKVIDEETKDIMYDPKTLCLENFVDLINNVYANKCDGYVVYNKSYEHTRMKEMIRYLQASNYDKKVIEDVSSKLEHIINNTIDLMEVFTISEKEYGIFLHSLKAKYSIKKIEKFVTKNNIHLKHMIKPYNSLDVQNGLMAMNLAISRYVGVVGDYEWKEKTKQLKEYCHNDVLAMIMTYDFIDMVLRYGFKNFNNDIDIFK